LGIVFGKGLPSEDMEFHRVHPTGLGILISEAVRGEGGRGDAGAKVRQGSKGPTDTLCDQYILCPQSDSNRHLTDFKSATTCPWISMGV
jgi:hypothetical protein